YSLEGDTYTECARFFDGELPTAFESTAESGTVLTTFKRVSSRSGQGDGRTDRPQGQWRPVSFVVGGDRAGEDELKGSVLNSRGEAYHTRIVRTSHGTVKVNGVGTPKELDLTYTDTRLKGKSELGVYERDGDTLTIQFSDFGRPRPTVIDPKNR